MIDQTLEKGSFFMKKTMKHIISLKEQSKEDLLAILKLALKVKRDYKKGKRPEYLKNRTLIMLFEKTSTRTRLSFETGMTQLGGHAIFLDARTTQLAIGTDFVDEIRAIMRFGDIMMYRAMKTESVELAAALNQIPVIDALSKKYHPCQALGDLLTMIEQAGGVNKIGKIAWLGIENNVSNTLKLACAKLGIKVVLLTPEVDKASVDPELNLMAEKTGNIIKTTDLKAGLKGVSFVHTDTWMDMEFFEGGKVRPQFAREYKRRVKVFMPYQLNAKLINTYAPKAKIMHCMACHIGYEITRDAVDHPNSVIFDQAENRLHVQKAMMLWLLGIKA